MRIDIRSTTATPQTFNSVLTGYLASIAVQVTDVDSHLVDGACWNTQDWGDGTVTGGNADKSPCSSQLQNGSFCSSHDTRHGPWVPPQPSRSALSDTLQHTYHAPGVYTVLLTYVTASPSGDECYDPYKEIGTKQVKVTISF
jgi:hypothetical protein